MSFEHGLSIGCIIDEEQHGSNVVILEEYTEEQFPEHRRLLWIDMEIEHVVPCGIDGDVQPELLVVATNHRIVQRHSIR